MATTLPARRAFLADRARVKESGIGREGSKHRTEEWLELKYHRLGGI